MEGLKIKTVSGIELIIEGPVTYRDFAEGRVYYCAGQSWPCEIVAGIIGAAGAA